MFLSRCILVEMFPIATVSSFVSELKCPLFDQTLFTLHVCVFGSSLGLVVGVRGGERGSFGFESRAELNFFKAALNAMKRLKPLDKTPLWMAPFKCYWFLQSPLPIKSSI